MFSSRTFMVLGLTFKSLIHFEFILMCGVRRWSSFIFLHVTVQFFQHHLLNKLSLVHCTCLLPLSSITWLYRYGFISGLSIYSIDLAFLFMPCNFYSTQLTNDTWNNSSSLCAYWTCFSFYLIFRTLLFFFSFFSLVTS